VLAEKALGLPALLKSATVPVNLIENASADMWGNLSDQRSSYRRAIRSPSRLHCAGDPFLLLVDDPFATLDKFVGLINESRSLALQILSSFICLGTHQISCFISLASDSIASAGATIGCKEDSDY
jgi:hypothetical protein